MPYQKPTLIIPVPTEENPNQTYRELLRSIRVILKKKYSQKAQLSSSHHIVRSRFPILYQ